MEMDVKKAETGWLIEMCVMRDKIIKKANKEMNAFKTELQERGGKIMDDKNSRFVKFYSPCGTAAVMDSMKLDVLNPDKLRELLGEGLYKQKVKETEEVKLKFDTKLEKALKAAFVGDYTFEYTMEEFLDHMGIRMTPEQKKVLLKKIKGDYEKDSGLMESVFGKGDYETECWFFYKIRNGELIRAFLGEEAEAAIEQLKKYILVETKTAIAIDYEKEDEES